MLRVNWSRPPSSSSIWIEVRTWADDRRTRSWHRRTSAMTSSHCPSIHVPEGVNKYGRPEASTSLSTSASWSLHRTSLPSGTMLNSKSMACSRDSRGRSGRVNPTRLFDRPATSLRVGALDGERIGDRGDGGARDRDAERRGDGAGFARRSFGGDVRGGRPPHRGPPGRDDPDGF